MSRHISNTFWTLFPGLKHISRESARRISSNIPWYRMSSFDRSKSPEALRSKYAHVPWQDVPGMRNKLIHDYLGVDIPTVWLAPQDDLLVPEAVITQILKEL